MNFNLHFTVVYKNNMHEVPAEMARNKGIVSNWKPFTKETEENNNKKNASLKKISTNSSPSWFYIPQSYENITLVKIQGLE